MFDPYQFDSILKIMKEELSFFNIPTVEKDICEYILKYRDTDDEVFLANLCDATLEIAHTEHINNDNSFFLTSLTQHECDLIRDNFEERLRDSVTDPDLGYTERDKALVENTFTTRIFFKLSNNH